MAIDRGPWNALVDDDGSNLIGSVWNKAAIKTVILDPTDAAITAVPVAAPTYGNFTPVDASGSSLVFSYAAGQWSKFGKVVTYWMQVVYPTTADAGAARIAGLPFIIRLASGATQGFGSPLIMWQLPVTSFAFAALNPSNSLALPNSSLSGGNYIITGTYLTD